MVHANMKKTQADAIVQAIMEPDIRVQEETRRKHAVVSAQLARRRRVAWFSLVGAGVGTAIAYYAGVRFPLGIIYGGLAGSAVGWLVTHRVAA
jgi:hypothetical protein